MPRLHLPAAAVLLLLPATALADAEADEAAVRQVVDRFFAAYAQKDLDGFMACWVEKSPDYAARKQTMARIFAETGPLALKGLAVVKLHVGRDAARARVRAEVAGTATRTGKPHPDLGRMNRVIRFARSEAGWRIVRYTPAEQDLADRLAAAQSKEDRATLLADDKDLVTPDFAYVVRDRAMDALRRQKPAEAASWLDLALEVAGGLGDKVVLAALHLSYGYLHETQAQYGPALRYYERALALFREAADRLGEAKALYNVGNALMKSERFPDALERFDESLAVCRERGFREGEAYALQNSAVALEAMGRYAEAVSRYEASLAVKLKLGDPRSEARTRNSLGQLLYRMGRYADALRQYEACAALHRRLGDAADEEDSLFQVGNVYLSTARYPEALAQFEQCLALARGRGDRVREAAALSNVGLVYAETGRPAENLARQEACLEIARATGARWLEAKALGNLGNACDTAGRYAEALRHHEDALRIQQDLGKRDSVIATRTNIANVYQLTGRFEEAIGLYEANVKAARETGFRVAEAIARNNLGVALFSMGRYADGAAQLEAALRLYGDLGDRHGQAKAQSALGRILLDTGRYADALRQYEAALATSRAIGDRQQEGTCLTDIGQVLLETGRYGEALARMESGLAIRREMGDRLGEAGALNSLGLALYRAARPEEAARQFEASLKLARELGTPYNEAVYLRNLGWCEFMAKRFADAVRRHEAALAIERSLKIRHEEAHTLHALASAYSQLERYADAARAYEACLGIFRDIADRRSEGLTLMKMGVLSLAQKRHDEAGERLRAALAVAEPLGDVETVMRAYGNLGWLHSERKEWAAAAAAYRRSIAETESLRAELRETSLRAGFLGQNTDRYINLAVCLLEEARPAEAFAVAEQAKARALVDLLRDGKADVRKGMTDVERREDDRLREAVTALEVQLDQTRANRVAAARQQDLARRLADARDEYDRFRRRVFLAHPELQARQARFDPASLVELNRTLFAHQPGLCVLSYLVGDDELLVFVLRRGPDAAGPARLDVRRVPAGEKDLAGAVEAFRRACQRPAGGAPEAEDLSGWLLAPAAGELAGADHLIIVPDGVLHTLPFQALKDPDGKYLVERCSVSYAPSATALVKMADLADRRRKGNGAAANLLAVGRPAFGGALKDLPASEPEVRAIAGLYGDRATLLLGSRADKADVLAALGSARYVHLATHGLLNEAAPLYSAIALTPAPGRDDGRLYARDLLDLDLRAELVVLSACETALGQRVSGEGVLGLAWALFVAGAPSSVVTQWSVADESTGALMAAFHERLAAGAAKAEALRGAQLALLRDRKTRHPFYWAPFVLIGDWR